MARSMLRTKNVLRMRKLERIRKMKAWRTRMELVIEKPPRRVASHSPAKRH